MSASIKNAIALVFIDGIFAPDQSNWAELPKELLFCPFNAVVNWLQGAFLYVPKNCIIKTPIHFIFKNSGQPNAVAYLRNTVVLEENSELTLIEEFTSIPAENGKTQTGIELQLGKQAKLIYHKLQNEDVSIEHQATVMLQQQESSFAQLFFADVGAAEAKANVRIHLHEKYAGCDINGLYCLHHDTQHIKNHVHIDHLAEHGTSSMHFKGILDKRARAEFVGKVFVHENAQHINARQANHNLLLSPYAEVITKPELEIYADDVKCAHGATVGQLDEEALFYLRSRGIEKTEAQALLTEAFADDVINKIENVNIRQYIQGRMNSYEIV